MPPPSCPLSGRPDRMIIEGSRNKLGRYSPGNMMWASDVPENITQEPPASRTSGSPTSFPVRFGTAINECLTAVASLLPQNLYHMEPTSDMMRVQSFPAAATAEHRQTHTDGPTDSSPQTGVRAVRKGATTAKVQYSGAIWEVHLRWRWRY